MHLIWKIAVVMVFTVNAALAQTVVPADGDLAAIVQAEPDGGKIMLTGSAYTSRIDVLGKNLSITGDEDERPLLSSADGSSVIYIDSGGTLELEHVKLTGATNEQAAIFVDGGQLTIRNSQFDGPFRFGIYATAGSQISVDGITMTGGENGIYFVDGGSLDLKTGEINGSVKSAITLAGKEIKAAISVLTINGAGQSGIAVRSGARAELTSVFVTDAKAHGLYMDEGASALLDDVIIDRTPNGFLAFDASELRMRAVEISRYDNIAVAVENAEILLADALQIEGNGPAFHLNGTIGSAEIRAAFMTNENPERPTLFLASDGAVRIDNVSTTGGYAGAYIQGPRNGETSISGSDFQAATFAGIVLQNTGTSEAAFAPKLDNVESISNGETPALVLDDVPLVSIANSALIAVSGPAVSAIESGTLVADNSIFATGLDEWLLGQIGHDIRAAGRGNVVETGVDISADNVREVAIRLFSDREKARQSAGAVGSVRTVNATGMKLFGNAVEIIATDASGGTFDIPTNGDSFDLAPGLYQLAIDSVAREPFAVETGKVFDIAIPPPTAPYFRFQDGDVFYRGEALRLLGRDEMIRRRQARGVVFGSFDYWNKTSFGFARPELTQDEKTALLDEAREIYFKYFQTAHNAYVKRSQEPADKEAGATVWYVSGVLSALGTLEDRDRLLAMLPEDASFPRDTAIEIASFIEARLGHWKDSALLKRAMQERQDNISLSIQMAVAAGRSGNGDAITFLIDIFTDPAADLEALSQSFNTPAMNLMVRSADPRVLPLVEGVLRENRDMHDELLAGTGEYAYRSKAGFAFYNLASLIEYVVAFNPSPDPDLLAVPIAGTHSMGTDVAGILANPAVIYLDHVGASPRPNKTTLYASHIPTYGQMICRSLERRSESERKGILSAYHALTAQPLNEAFYNMEKRREWIVGEAVTQVTSAYCNPNDRISGAYRRNRVNMEVFVDDEPTPVWADRPEQANKLLAAFEPSANWTPLRQLSVLTPDELAKNIADNPKFIGDAGRALVLNHRAISYAYQEPLPDVYPNGADRRVFLTAPASAEGAAILSGRVDMRPVLRDGRLRVGLRLRIAYDDSNFLAAKIGGRSTALEAVLKDGARGFVQEVTLRRGDNVIPMEFESSTNSNVHVFGAPYAHEDLSELSVHVRLGAIEEEWVMSFPLYIGDFAFRHRTRAQ